MCGIVGFVGDVSSGRLDRLVKARDLMVHRGPDDAGLSNVGAAHFGFRRLAILDLSHAGHQPMLSEDRSVALVFNGEIYNFRTLRRDLERSCRFRSDTDSEVLLKGYQEWGWEELLRRIDGMFAFAIWDDRKQTLFAARDRAGKKPFFYTRLAGGVAFASTLNALRELVPERNEIDPIALDAYLTYQALPSPHTMLKDVYQLAPAHQLRYGLEGDRLHTERYWELDYGPKWDKNEEGLLDDLDDLVRRAVRKRLVSDVPLGAFLSGGVDSSLVVSMMAQEQTAPVEAVVIGFEDPAFDERPFARKVAEKWGVNLHEHVLQSDAVSDLPEIIWHYGQPLADVSIVPTYYVAKAAKQHVTVVLNGDGGDEVFGGYARPMVARAAQVYRSLLPRGIRRTVGKQLGEVNGSAGFLKRVRMLTTSGQVSAREAFVYDRAFRRHRHEAYAPALQDAVAERHPDAFYQEVWDAANGVDDVDRCLYGDLASYLPDQLLTKMDVSTMAHSVEARSPLLDTALLEYAARIPTSLRLKGYTTKYLLKKLAERYVPRDVLYRRKRGFVMPTSDWLRGELAPYVEGALLDGRFAERGWIAPEFAERMVSEHMSGCWNWGEQIWTLFVLEIWSRMTLDGSLHRGDSLELLLR